MFYSLEEYLGSLEAASLVQKSYRQHLRRLSSFRLQHSYLISNSVDNLADKHFVAEKLIQKLENLASITVKLPKENIAVPGIYYFIFQRLAWEGIIINEVISTSNEFTILVREEQVDVAFKVIKDLKN